MISKLLGLREGEGRVVALCFIYSFFVGLPRLFTITGGTSLFVERFGPSNLPWIYMATAAFIPVLAWIYVTAGKKLPFLPVQIVTLLHVIAIQVALWAALQFIDADWARVGAVLLVEIEWIFGLVVFWNVANRLFSIRQAKRLFGIIGSGEVLGMVLGGFLMPVVAPALGGTHLLLCAAIGEVIAVICLLRLVPALRRAEEAADDEPEETDAAVEKTGVVQLVRDAYVRYPMAVIALLFSAYYFADAAFFQVAEQRYPNAEDLAGFTGVVLATAGICSFLGKTLVTGRWLTRFGLGGSLVATPVILGAAAILALTAASFGLAAAVIFWAVVLVKLAERVTMETFTRPGYSTLLQPLPMAQRTAAQSAGDAQVAEVAGGVTGAILILLLGVFDVGLASVLVGLVLLCGGWYLIARRAGRAYPEKLAASLASRGLTGTDLNLDDPATQAALRAKLASPEPSEVMYCLRLLVDANHASLPETLLEQIRHAEPDVRRVAFAGLSQCASAEHLETLTARLDAETEPLVVAAAVGAVAAAGEEDALETLQRYSADPNPTVRGAALAAILRSCGPDIADRACEELLALSLSSEHADRRLAAWVVGEAGDESLAAVLIPLFDDEELGVRAAALRAAGALGAPRTWPHVIDALADRSLRAPAAGSLVSGGLDALVAMEDCFGETAEHLRAEMVHVAGRMRREETTRFLIPCLDDPGLYAPALIALQRTGYTAEDVDRVRCDGLLEHELRRATRCLLASDELGDATDAAALQAAVELDLRRVRERVFRILSFLYRPEMVARVSVNWRAGSARRRAFAVELLSTLLSREHVAALLPLLDDIPPDERRARMVSRYHVPERAADERVLELARDDAGLESAWTRACALVLTVTRRLEGAAAAVENVPGDVGPVLARVAEEQAATLDGRTVPDPLITRVEQLQSASIFREVPVDLLGEIALELETIEMADAQQLFAAGDLGTTLYVVASGLVRVHDATRTFATLEAGTIVGEMAALDPEPRSASVTAEGPARLLALSQERLFELMDHHPDVTRGILSVLCGRIQGSLDVSAGTSESLDPIDGDEATRTTPQETMGLIEKVVFLKTADLFAETPDHILSEVATRTREVRLDAGRTLIREGELGDRMYILVAGEVLIHRGDHEIARLGRRTVLGEMGVISSSARSASATATEDTVLLSLDQETLDELMGSQPEVTRAILRVLVRRLRAST